VWGFGLVFLVLLGGVVSFFRVGGGLYYEFRNSRLNETCFITREREINFRGQF
jgi:hypothetical protein